MSQIHQVMGDIPMSAAHPVFHSFVVSIFVTIGDFFGDMNIGVALYSITQMLLMSCVFAVCLMYMKRKGFHKYIGIGALLYFSLFPIHAMFSITMWKDILFGGVMLLFTICVIEMLINTEDFLRNKKYLVLFALATLGVILLRNNGFYVFLLSFPIFILVLKGYRKRLGALFAMCLIFYMVLMGPVLSVLNIKKGMSREGLSVPLQQIARVVKFRGDELTDKEREFIRNCFPPGDTIRYYTESTDAVQDYLAYIYMLKSTDNIGEQYNPRLSDPVKDCFDEDYYQEHKVEFFTSWFKLFFRFPKEYVESYLSGSFGYWYPEAYSWTVSYGMDYKNPDIRQANPFPRLRAALEHHNIYNMRDIPVISMMYSIGFNFILLVLSVLIVCLKKQYKFILAFLPVLFLMLTATASPVYAEFRYAYSLFTCLPLLIALALWLKQESGVRSQESGVRSQESGVRSQESGVRSQKSEVRNQNKE
jgi:hypothetical protein